MALIQTLLAALAPLRDGALVVRDLGFLLYGGPLVAFTLLIALAGRLPQLAPWDLVRAYRAWGPGLGLSLGATVFGALLAHGIDHQGFSWGGPGREGELLPWGLFFAVWVSNIILEIWTLDPLRKLDDREAGVRDPAAYAVARAALVRHMALHSALILGLVAAVRLA